MKKKPEHMVDVGRRSEIISVGLDPKLRYLAELGARQHRRSLSNYIEWAIERSLKKVVLREHPADANLDESVASKADCLWDVHEADRFVKLALNYPGLLTNEELVLWKLICANRFLWRDFVSTPIASDGANWMSPEKYLIFERLREHWDAFKAVARGESDMAILPVSSSTGSNPEPLNERV